MRRRDFIAGLGGAAVVGPRGAGAQQVPPLIGFLHGGSATPVIVTQVTAFRQGLKEGGFTEGSDVRIEYRWAEGKMDLLPELAADLVRRNVNVIVALSGPPSTLAAKNATTTTPVVGADPVKVGLVTNIRRPGGNVTGVSFFTEELNAKALGLLHELVPRAKTVGLLANPGNSETPRRSTDTAEAARKLGLSMKIVNATTPVEIDTAFDTLVERQAGALLVGGDVLFSSLLDHLVSLAARHRMPTMFSRREFAEAGGLASYGTSVVDAYRQTGLYVARVLKGEKPAELPVIQTVKFEFVINLKTARTLGIDVPMAFSAAADTVIE